MGSPVIRISWKLLLASGILSVLSTAPLALGAPKVPIVAPKGNVPKPPILKLFKDGQLLFKAERFNEAKIAFERALRLYPGHEPSLILYARTLYKVNNLPEAYKAFSRINIASLDAETSYEYGQTFFQGAQYEGAMAAFKKIPDGNSLADLANYYGAVSAVKLKRYAEAEEMLEKALVLPDKLAKSRSLYLKHVQEMRLLQEKQSLQKERGEEKRRIAESKRVATAKAAPPKEEPKAPEPWKHKGTQEVVRSGRIDYEQKQQTVDFHSYGDKDSKIDVATFKFSHGPIFQLPMTVEDRSAALGAQLMLKAEDRKTVGRERRFVSEASQEDLIRILNKPPEDVHTKQGEAELTPWIELPLPVRHWLAFAGDIDFVYPDFETGNRTGSRGGYVQLAGSKDVLSYNGSYKYTQFLDNKSEAGSSLNRVKGQVVLAWPSGFGVDMEVRHDEYEYVDTAVDGPDASSLAKGTLSQKFPLGITLSLAGTYELQENYFFHGLPDRPVVKASGNVYTGKAALLAEPFPWISLGVSQLISQTQWRVNTAEDQDIFERNVPSYSSELSFTAALIMAL